MREPSASTPSTSWIAQVEAWPVHSARRSFQNFRNHILAQVEAHPELTFLAEGLLLHTQHTEVEPKGFFHYAAESIQALGEGLERHWSEYECRIRGCGLQLIEVWAGGVEDAQVLATIGFVPGDQMAWYHSKDLATQPPDPRVRPFDPARDFERLLEIHQLTSPPEWVLSHDAYLAWVQTVATRVLEIDGQVAGFTHLRQIETQGLFDGLAVHPDFQRRGLASALVRDAVSWLASQGVTSLDLFVLTTNEAALALYDRLHFERRGLQVQMKRPL